MALNNTHSADDPLFLRYELATALDEYDRSPNPRAALGVAAALGKSRLFAIDLDGRLPADMAEAAIDGLLAAVTGWVKDARNLGAGADDGWDVELDDSCITLLEHRVDGWGAVVAVTEAAAAHPAVAARVQECEVAVHTFDRWLRAREEDLCGLIGLPLLGTWRVKLAPAYRDPLPWWLDGTLPAAAARIKQAAIATSYRGLLSRPT